MAQITMKPMGRPTASGRRRDPVIGEDSLSSVETGVEVVLVGSEGADKSSLRKMLFDDHTKV